MNDLIVNALAKKFGSKLVIEDVSFEVKQGEFFVLLGPSGGGKSTLLRLICGLETPDAGQVILAGRDITRLPPRERNIGMVFQDYGLYPHMNVTQNIAYGLEARGMKRPEVEKRVEAAADRLGLTPLLKRVIVDLSGGEQQRVALARALAKEADLFLFDEPLSNLDPKLRSQARRDILMVHREKNRPTLYVTHDQAEAMSIADRIAIIAKGKLQQVGTVDNLLNQPANLYVAGFIGVPPVNLIPGSLVRAAATMTEKYLFKTASWQIPIPNRWTTALDRYLKDQIIIGIRPVDLGQVGRTAPHINPKTITTGEVVDIVPLIGETIVNFKTHGSLLSATFQEIDESFAPGQRLQIGVDTTNLRLFDPDTEMALTEGS